MALGPGIATRNAYAGIWLMPIAAAFATGRLSGALIGAIAGAAHGSARAAGILANVRTNDPTGPFAVMGQQLRWRWIDGLVLTLAAGGIVGASV